LGIEADWQWANLTDNQTVSTSVAAFNQFTANAQQDLEFFGTARGRLGFTPVEPVLLYVTGRLAYGQVKLSGAITNPACFGFCGTTSTTKPRAVGPWAEGWNTRSHRAGRRRLNTCITIWELFPSKSSILDPRTPNAFIAQSVEFKGNIVRAGVNYRFFGDDSDY
jgi:outer membrane immunogenic protein